MTASATVGNASPPPDGTRVRAARRPLGLRGAIGPAVSAVVLLIGVLWAVAPGVFTDRDPIASDPAQRLLPPSSEHWFGTDLLGRDQYSRVVYGSVHSLTGAALAVAVGLIVGVLLGLWAGYAGAWTESIVMRVVDTLLATPALLLSMAIVVAFGFGTTNAAIAVGVTSIATFTRLMRGEVLAIRGRDYVEAARAVGTRPLAVAVKHVLPNCLVPVLALAALQFGAAILAIATLGFLGFGTPPPTPEWGLLVSDGRDYMAFAWWLTVLPGLVIVAMVLAAGRLSAYARRQL
ncbi:ABC transporter permease [Rhodococcoides yunnanense]|uniref:ABC transporter permease n=1 Tax=Rhodococcoides yunnanense TaxID=278209 RepID=UPI00093523B5|nr:ABC transporter permease [Rhodococcus yunnanensis]